MPSSVKVGGSRTSRMHSSGVGRGDRLVETVGVGHRGDHVVAGVFEQAHEAFAQQDGVLADQDAHGTLTSRRSDRRRAVEAEGAARREDAVGDAVETAAGDHPRAADAVVLDAGPEGAVRRAAAPGRGSRSRGSAWRRW